MATTFDRRFQAGSRQLIQDFTSRQRRLHREERGQALEEIGARGGIQRDIALALGNLRTARVTSLEKLRQRFQLPEQEQRLKAGKVDIEQAAFDLGLAKKFTPGLLRGKAAEAGLYTDYLREKLEELRGGGEAGIPQLPEVPVSPISGRRPIGLRNLGKPFGRIPLYKGEGGPEIDPKELLTIMKPHYPGGRRKKIPKALDIFEEMSLQGMP